MRYLSRCLLFVLAAVALGATCGCDHARPVVHPVTGLVLVDGKPAGRARVAFHPNGDAPDAALPRPVAITEADGTFRLMTFKSGDGAPAGVYAVTVIWPDPTHEHDECEDEGPDDQLHGHCADRRNPPLVVTVRPGPNDFTLRLSTRGDPPDS